MALANPRHEIFAQAIARGSTQADAARTAGYSQKRAYSTGSNLSRDPQVIARITQLTARIAQATAKVIQEAEDKTTEVFEAVAVTRAWVIRILQRNIEEARLAQQYGVVKQSVELAAKVAGVYVERTDHRIEFPTDLSQCTEEQLQALYNLELQLLYGSDEAAKRQAKRKLELEAGLVVDTTAEAKEDW